jgi:hypothetical protein
MRAPGKRTIPGSGKIAMASIAEGGMLASAIDGSLPHLRPLESASLKLLR